MSPKFKEDEDVLVSFLPYLVKPPKTRDVVLFEKYNKFYIKRIGKIKEGKYFLVGDNKKDSFDSRRFGSVNRSQIKGKVIKKLT